MTAPRPFDGLRVIDMGTFWAGPFLGCYLGALGADVVKVEAPRRVDGFRFLAAFPEQGPKWYEASGLFQATNMNKRDVAVDLDRPQGLEIILELIASADVLIENFSPRVVEQFGLNYTSLDAANSRLIYVRMPGFGLDGPWRDFVGFGNSFEYAGGIAAITGYADGPPMGPGGYADPLVAMHAATVLTAALEERERTGLGMQIEVPQVEVVGAMTPDPPLVWAATGRVVGRVGNRDPRFAPQGVYGATDGWVAVTVRDDAEWHRLVALVGPPPLDPPAELDDVSDRQAHHDELDQWILAWCAPRTVGDVLEALSEQKIAAARVLDPAHMYSDRQLDATGYYQTFDHPVSGTRRYPTWPFRWGTQRQRVQHRRRAPLLGEHVEEILVGELGRTNEEIMRLRDAGVLGDQMHTQTNDT